MKLIRSWTNGDAMPNHLLYNVSNGSSFMRYTLGLPGLRILISLGALLSLMGARVPG